MKRYAKLANTALHYDRFTAADYGTRGKAFSPIIDEEFAKQSDAAFKELFAALKSKMGVCEVIASGGVSREGSGRSMHHRNRAFDLDGLFFKDGKQITMIDFPEQPHLYLAIEAILRRHFGVVLGYDYDPHHRDHIHFDNSRGPGFKRDARSHTIFVQNALYYVYALKLGLDGVWGPETEAVSSLVRDELEVGPFSKDENWMKFCELTAKRALDMV